MELIRRIKDKEINREKILTNLKYSYEEEIEAEKGKIQVGGTEIVREDSSEQDNILVQIIQLLGQAETALQKKDYQQLARLLAEIKELAEQEIKGLDKVKLQAEINKLEQAILNQQNQTNWPLIISSIVIIPIVLVIVVLLIKKWVSYDLRKKPNSSKLSC